MNEHARRNAMNAVRAAKQKATAFDEAAKQQGQEESKTMDFTGVNRELTI
jgi:hypothetical protein